MKTQPITRDEIFDMACEFYTYGGVSEREIAFARFVMAKEREACAKVCDEKVDAEYATGKVDHNEMGWTQACAISIRARGQA